MREVPPPVCQSVDEIEVLIALRQHKAVCRAEIPKCKARCKAGEKYFIGIGGSNRYPIDTCI